MEEIGNLVEQYAKSQASITKLTALSLTTSDMVNRPEARMEFLRDLEAGRALQRAEITAITRVMVDKLGLKPEDWLQSLNAELAVEITRLEQTCGITGYDGDGNPVFAQAGKEESHG